MRYARFESAPQLAVLSTRFGSRADWLRAGQALQRVLLTATAGGVAAGALTQALETADAWLVRDPASGIEHPQMVLRLGYGPPGARLRGAPSPTSLMTRSAISAAPGATSRHHFPPGVILAVKALYELCRTGSSYALTTLTTMCIGGGQGIAAIFERL